MKTRMFFVALLVVLAVTVVACAPEPTKAPAPAPTTAPAQPTVAPAQPTAAQPTKAPEATKPPAPTTVPQPFKGTTLRVVGANHPWAEAMKKLIPDFETQTGMKINFELYGEDQLNQKLTTEFTAGNSDIDVFMQRPLQEAKVMAQNKWYVDLLKYTKDTAKTPASYDFADLMPGAIGTETVGGALTGIPIVTEQEVLYFRKDLLEKAGLKVPKTLDELKTAAEKLTDKSKEMYGFVARGQRSPAVTQFSSFLYSFGGDWFDLNTRKATIDTPEALAAFKFYGDLLRNYAPPGTTNMSWPQAVAIFAQGKVAMYTDANSIYANLLDPTKSAVADKTGVAVFPAGPKGQVMYNVTSWGLSIGAQSKKQDAAWEFVKWATSKEIMLKTQGDGAVPGSRTSVWGDPKGKAKFPADWVEATAASAKGRGYDRPLVVQVTNARDIIGDVIVTAIEGGDVPAAAKKANTDFQKLLDSEK